LIPLGSARPRRRSAARRARSRPPPAVLRVRQITIGRVSRRLDGVLWTHLQEVLEHDHSRILTNRRKRFLQVGHLHDHHALPKLDALPTS